MRRHHGGRRGTLHFPAGGQPGGPTTGDRAWLPPFFAVGEAADYIIHQELNTKEGNGGLIAVDKKGNFAMPFNSGGMFRGYLYKEKGTGKISKAVGIGKKMKTL